MHDKHNRSRGCGCCGGCQGCLLTIALVLWATFMVWHTSKPLPDGLRMEGSAVTVPTSDIDILADVTARDDQGQPLIEQTIFDRMMARIGAARQLVLVDNFFFSPITGRDGSDHRKLCSELTKALISAKNRHPDMPVVVITDPINSIYGGEDPPHLQALRAAGISLVKTDLTKLRDSNPLYSALVAHGPILVRPTRPPEVSSRIPSRQTGRRSVSGPGFPCSISRPITERCLLTDDGSGAWGVIIGSLNAHDGSSRHSNFAMEISSAELARQVWTAETAVIAMSGRTPPPSPLFKTGSAVGGSACRVSLLTEGAIRDAIIDALNRSGLGDAIDAAFFYLSHRGVRRALIEAAERGAEIRLILDPSKDAFGRTKNGIPNRQAALDLMNHGRDRITVRWYDTHGEQFHPKIIAVHHPAESTIIMGSANMTRRNLDDFNLETDVRIRCDRSSPPATDVRQWFDRLWFNDDLHATVEFEAFEDRSQLRKLLADIQERTGMGTF